MTSMTAIVGQPFIKERDDNIDVPHLRTFRDVVGRELVRGYYLGPVYNGTQSMKFAIGYYIYPTTTETIDREVKFTQHGEDSDALIVVDFGGPITEFPEAHQEVVQSLRDNGRPVLADKLFAMLQNVDEDPDGPTINVASMRDMASLLAEYNGFADPSISPDGFGVIHAQWRIVGDGLLVISFLGYGECLLTAQADENDEREELNISQRGWAPDILGAYGYLVPLRD